MCHSTMLLFHCHLPIKYWHVLTQLAQVDWGFRIGKTFAHFALFSLASNGVRTILRIRESQECQVDCPPSVTWNKRKMVVSHWKPGKNHLFDPFWYSEQVWKGDFAWNMWKQHAWTNNHRDRIVQNSSPSQCFCRSPSSTPFQNFPG